MEFSFDSIDVTVQPSTMTSTAYSAITGPKLEQICIVPSHVIKPTHVLHHLSVTYDVLKGNYTFLLYLCRLTVPSIPYFLENLPDVNEGGRV